MKLQVCEKLCDECLFTPNRIVRDGAKEDIVEECLKADKYFICHKSTIVGREFVCRGFWNKHRNDVLPLRLAQMWNLVEYVEIPHV